MILILEIKIIKRIIYVCFAAAALISTVKPGTGKENVTKPSPTFPPKPMDPKTRIRFELTGVNADRLVRAKPGENVTITCKAIGTFFSTETTEWPAAMY